MIQAEKLAALQQQLRGATPETIAQVRQRLQPAQTESSKEELEQAFKVTGHSSNIKLSF